ncbi:MAG: glycosyltransferase family 39 protein [Phycisphaerales bacterium]|nr:glycosyltransferase family 39 protein [Phycisphaerales bacterium]MCB9835110.1 glycosyltransferase family 39 protein [Phycisphaera sp.]
MDQPTLNQPEASAPHARWRFWILLLLVTSSLTSFAGTGASLPLDAHEVFVARTAEEMHARGEWLVPYFNDTPRLKKPPLEYWLVLGVNLVTGNDGVITEFEARFPSALAGVLLTLMAVRLGRQLVSAEAGLIAGAMLATCSGFISYTHSARPEMVYAAWCIAGLLGLVSAEQHTIASRKREAMLAALGAWFCFGLATMTKGPQLPLPMLVGWLFGAWRAGTIRETTRSLRLAVGVPIYLVVGFWWFALVLTTVPNAVDILKGETIDRITSQTDSWVTLLEPYYLYRPLLMLAPWLFFVPGSLVGPWLKKYRTRPGAMRMWWLIFFVAIILSFSRGRRWYYMLPMLAPYAVVLGSTAMLLAPDLWKGRKSWGWVVLFGLHAVGLAVFAGVTLDRHSAYIGHAPIWMYAVIALCCITSVMMLALRRIRNVLGVAGVVVVVGAFASISLAIAAHRGGFWRSNRLDERAFSMQVAAHVASGDTLVGWLEPFEEQQYELHRVIPTCFVASDLTQAIKDAREAFVMVDIRRDPVTWPDGFKAERLVSSDNGHTKGQFELWHVRVSGVPSD